MDTQAIRQIVTDLAKHQYGLTFHCVRVHPALDYMNIIFNHPSKKGEFCDIVVKEIDVVATGSSSPSALLRMLDDKLQAMMSSFGPDRVLQKLCRSQGQFSAQAILEYSDQPPQVDMTDHGFFRVQHLGNIICKPPGHSGVIKWD